MQISMKMSNFSPGESDSRIRKPVAKKKIKMLTDQVFHWEANGADETIYDHWINGLADAAVSVQVLEGIAVDLDDLGRVGCADGGRPLLGGASPEAALANLSLVGSMLVFCVGVNLIWPRTFKPANMLPSVVIAVVYALIAQAVA